MLGQIRVLVADDLQEIRTLVRTNLEFDGRFEVVGEAANGLEAVDLVRELNPDVVILDLAMPEMDGLAAISKIRQTSPGTKILVLSAFADDHNSGLVRDLGANGFIAKDRPMEEIVDAVAEVAEVPAPE
ncbi:MAG TPA: response regulator transcription factor [Actinomycetota bacterium]|nr:response regulator transcription factor [Actinomycetota bacterium]